MAKHCEACAALARQSTQGALGTRIRNVLIGDRIVCLCDDHARVTEAQDLASVDELRAVLREPEGRRALVTRRSPIDRRAFPPRPEGRRGQQGRRSSDGTE